MARRNRNPTVVHVVSFVLHAAALAAIAAISTGHVPRPISVMMVEVAHPAPPPPPPPPPAESPARPEPQRSHAAPRSAAAEAAPAATTEGSNLPDYGIALAGVSSGPGGIAIPIGDPGGVRREEVVRVAERTLAPAPVAQVDRRCREDEVPPRQQQMPRVVYTQEALELAVEGRVRLSVTLDDEGRVTAASVLSPLGHGLDEAALDAVRAARFEPATRCGRAVATTFVLGVRFRI